MGRDISLPVINFTTDAYDLCMLINVHTRSLYTPVHKYIMLSAINASGMECVHESMPTGEYYSNITVNVNSQYKSLSQ